MRNLILASTAALLAACSSLPSYEEPTGSSRSQSASIEKTGSALSLCGITGSPVCSARVNTVDGKKTSSLASSVLIEPGVHRLQLFCFAKIDITIGGARGFFRNIEVSIPPRAKYRVDAQWVDNSCRLSLFDIEANREVEIPN